MKIYLLNPPSKYPFFSRTGRWQGVGARGISLWYPIWLSYACGVLEENYKDVKLVDAVARKLNENDILRDIEKFNPDMIVVDTNFSSLKDDIALCEKIKNTANNATVIVVGSPTTVFPNDIMKSRGVDIICRLEYDFTLIDIAKSLEKNTDVSNVKGISYKDNNGKIIHNQNRELLEDKELDKIPFVTKVYKKHLDIKDYYLDHTLWPMVQIFTGRGCPNLCTFCSWPNTLMGRRYRARSVNNIVDEIEYVKENLPEVKEIFFEDDTFTINPKRVEEVANEIIARGLDITWSCNARANLDYSTLKKMKKSGCRFLVVGYESGNEEILKNIKKGVTLSQMEKFAEDARKAGLYVLGDFIFGLPGESKETIKKTKEFIINKIKPDLLQIAVATPIPGTPFYNFAKEKGYLTVDDMSKSIDENGYQKSIISYPNLSSDEIEKLVDNALKEYYLNINYVPIAFRRIISRYWWHEIKMLFNSTKRFIGYMIR